MGQDVETLRTDIERRREDLGETLDAIGDRISPGRMITRRRNRMSEGFRSFKDRVMGTVSDTVQWRRTPHQARSLASRTVSALTRSASRPRAARWVSAWWSFGVGFIAAALFPATQAEETAAAAVKEKAEPLTGELAAAGREVAADLKEHAGEATRSSRRPRRARPRRSRTRRARRPPASATTLPAPAKRSRRRGRPELAGCGLLSSLS